MASPQVSSQIERTMDEISTISHSKKNEFNPSQIITVSDENNINFQPIRQNRQLDVTASNNSPVVNERSVENGFDTNRKFHQNGLKSNGQYDEVNGNYSSFQSFTNGKHEEDYASMNHGNHENGGFISSSEDEYFLSNPLNSQPLNKPIYDSNLVVEAKELTNDVLHDLFNDKICVLCIRNYVPQVVCQKLDSFLREKGSEPYTHEIRKDGKLDLLYFGVNRYGYPLNSIYNDDTGENLKTYLSEALPTIRSIRKAAAPYLSPIDKFRVELDEVWPKKANVATFHGQKTFCGIGRIMPTSLSELSEVQPHFDAVPTSCFPDIFKQFTANFYLNVPEEGGELEIWNIPPLDISKIEKFTIPDNWRESLPASIKVKPGQGDLLLFNTRRPHAITKFRGPHPRTSVQTFIGLTKESEVFLWV